MVAFRKMHGLGNDFVVLDGRPGASGGAPVPTPALARALADRHRGVGCDQIALIEAAEGADLALRFWNRDGSESAACGNATRCVARAEMDRTGAAALTIRTARGTLRAEDRGGVAAVDMGRPLWGWRDVPLAEPLDTDRLPLPGEPVATSMGNPHLTFFVADAEAVDLAAFGPPWEAHPLFPQRTNVQVAQVIAPDRVRMRVWERGAGVTLASGSSSCATVVAGVRRGLLDRRATVALDGGELEVDWREDGLWLAGPAAEVFSGTLSPAWLDSAA